MPSFDEEIVLWAKNRCNYVNKIHNVDVRFKNVINFGITNTNETNSGQLFKSTWSGLLNLKPKIVGIDSDISAVLAFDQFIKRLQQQQQQQLQQSSSNIIKDYLANLCCLQLFESCDILSETSTLTDFVRYAEKLTIFEMHCVPDVSELVANRSKIFEQILPELKTKTKLKALSFHCPMSVDEANDWIDGLKLYIRLVSFNGRFGMDSLMKLRNEMPCVEMLALQSFDRRLRDDEIDEADDSRPIKIDEEKFFRKIEYVFLNLKMLFLDWNIIDSACLYFDDRTKNVCRSLHSLFKNLQMQCVAVLIYTPDDETKITAKKIIEFFEKENEPDGVKVRYVEFSVSPETPNNFTLIVFGDYHYQARTKRMIEVISEKRVTKPNLRHFCYIVDTDNLLSADLTMNFGGFNTDDVINRYQDVYGSTDVTSLIKPSNEQLLGLKNTSSNQDVVVGNQGSAASTKFDAKKMAQKAADDIAKRVPDIPL